MGEELNSEDHDGDEGFFGPGDASLDETVIYQDTSGLMAGGAEDIPPEVATVSNFRLIALIGRGGMGLVYRAYDLHLQRDVAVKILRQNLLHDRRIVDRFRNESLIKSSLEHPGVSSVYGVGTLDDGRPFYAMKLIEGKTLSQLLGEKKEGHFSLLQVIAQVCQTMAYAHSIGVVHLDLKPNNIMVGDFGNVLVIDWGLARRLDRDETQMAANASEPQDVVAEESGWIHGTPAYMSPEQARGETVDARADVFSLGAIICEILTGHPVYRGTSSGQMLRRAIRGATSQAMVNLEHSENELWLIGLVKRCLDVDPSKRPADARELAEELSDFQESALRLFESDMVRFFELSPDLFCIAGFDGCFRRVNANFPAATGYSEQELLSQPFLNFVHPDDKERTIAEMGRTLQGVPVERFRNRYLRRDGSILQLEWTAKSVVSEGLIFAVARDVTQDRDSDENA